MCYPASLPLIHPIALPHLKMDGEEAGGAPAPPRGGAPAPPRADGPVLGKPLETSASTRDSGVGSEVAASPPPIPPSSPTSSCSAPEQEDNEGEIDWNSQWGLGLVQPPTMTDTASG